MILIIYNLTIVINFNSCMFIIMIIIMTYRGCLSTNTYIFYFVIQFDHLPVGGGRMATYTLCRLITIDYLYNTM